LMWMQVLVPFIWLPSGMGVDVCGPAWYIPVLEDAVIDVNAGTHWFAHGLADTLGGKAWAFSRAHPCAIAVIDVDTGCG